MSFALDDLGHPSSLTVSKIIGDKVESSKEEMTDPISLATGTLGIASAFNTCITYFKYVQIGIHASSDFETTAVEMGVLMLRFTRWGEAAQVNDLGSCRPEKEAQLLQELLGQIEAVFKRAKTVSEGFKPTLQTGHSVVYDNKRDLEARSQRLCSKLMDISRSRKVVPAKGMPLARKFVWALYRKEHLNELVADISRLVAELENVFPTDIPRTHLCQLEVRQLESRGLEVLRAVVDGHNGLDPVLKAIVARLVDGGNVYRGNIVRGGARMHNGNFGATMLPATSKNNTYEQNSAFGKGAVLLNGDAVGGKSIWDT